jgi:Zn-finger nucleic acid-binding protein
MNEMDGIEKSRLSFHASEVEETLQFLQELECLHSESASPNDQIVAPGERECPICKRKMIVQGREALTADACLEHGVWLDSGELEAIIGRLRRGARMNTEHAYKMGYKKGYAEGMARASSSGGG